MSPPTIVSPEREAELDATEDAALQRAKQRAEERRLKKYQRINDPNISAEERARLQGELSRENSQKLSEMSKLKAASDEDHQLFTQLESSLRRVMSSKGVSDEVLARAADAEEVSDWIERGGDGEALPDSISQKMLSRGMSRQAVEELLKKGDDNVAGARAASTAAAPAAVVAEGDGFNVIRVGIVRRRQEHVRATHSADQADRRRAHHARRQPLARVVAGGGEEVWHSERVRVGRASC
jgi:hypothetical protein